MAQPRSTKDGNGRRGGALYARGRPLPAVLPGPVPGGREAPAVLWVRPSEGLAVAGYGAAAELAGPDPAEVLAQAAREAVRWLWPRPEGLPGPWFGGVAFDALRPPEASWAGFPAARFVVPARVVWRRGPEAGVAAFVRAPSEAVAQARLEAALDEAAAAQAGGPSRPAAPPGRIEDRTADRAAWEALMARALEAIRAGALEKVVLARPIDLRMAHPFGAEGVVARLARAYPTCTTFLFRAGDGAFVGATPETLFRADGREIRTEALAGTAAPGGRFGEKERREHQAVVDALRAGLGPLTTRLEAAREPEELVLPNVTHLRTPVTATLREGVGLEAVWTALHPTPAVGGTPREAALAFLREREGFDRGWYTGAVGWIGPGAAHATVGLRSALLRGRRARVFVGAGVVEGSSAEGEWRETEAKSQALLRALGGEDGRTEP